MTSFHDFFGKGASQRLIEQEVRALGRLDHPGIVSLLDSGVFERDPFVVIERVEGSPPGDRTESTKSGSSAPNAQLGALPPSIIAAA